MKIKRQRPKRLHGSIADSEQRQQNINLTDTDWIGLVHVIKGNCHDHQNWEHKQRDVVKRGILIKHLVVVVLGNKVIVVLLDQQLLMAQELGGADLADNFIIYF